MLGTLGIVIFAASYVAGIWAYHRTLGRKVLDMRLRSDVELKRAIDSLNKTKAEFDTLESEQLEIGMQKRPTPQLESARKRDSP